MGKGLGEPGVEAFQTAIREYNAGRPFWHYLKESQRLKLERMAVGGLVKTVAIRSGDPQRCSHCVEIEGRELTIDDALREMPLPAPALIRSGPGGAAIASA